MPHPTAHSGSLETPEQVGIPLFAQVDASAASQLKSALGSAAP